MDSTGSRPSIWKPVLLLFCLAWLFDLQEDPKEQNNLYGTVEGEVVVGDLKALMEGSG